MKEVFEISFSGINLIPTILLVVVILYWITVFIGLLDTSSLDIDLDSHANLDFDAHPHAEIHVDSHPHIHGAEGVAGGPNFIVKTLLFFNIGKIPFMILLSFIALPLWLISMLFNNLLHNDSTIISLLFLFPEIVVSMIIAKLITSPIVRVFQKMDDETGQFEDFTGKTAIVKIPVDKDSDGQIELTRNNSNVLLIARSTHENIKTGEQVLIIEYKKEEKYYIVEPFKI
jgi:hypothetical protein